MNTEFFAIVRAFVFASIFMSSIRLLFEAGYDHSYFTFAAFLFAVVIMALWAPLEIKLEKKRKLQNKSKNYSNNTMK